MRLIVDLIEDGPVNAETVRQNVQRAIGQYRMTEGLSGDDDEGFIGLPILVELEEDLAQSKIERIHYLLNRASIIADEAGIDETSASDPFTFLAQLIDSALARAEEMAAPAEESLT